MATTATGTGAGSACVNPKVMGQWASADIWNVCTEWREAWAAQALPALHKWIWTALAARNHLSWESLPCAPSLQPSEKFPWFRIFPQNIWDNNVRKCFFYHHIKVHSSEYHFLRTADYHKICLGKKRRLKTELIQRQKGENTLFFSAGCWCCKQATILMFVSPLFSLLSIFKDDSCLTFLI